MPWDSRPLSRIESHLHSLQPSPPNYITAALTYHPNFLDYLRNLRGEGAGWRGQLQPSVQERAEYAAGQAGRLEAVLLRTRVGTHRHQDQAVKRRKGWEGVRRGKKGKQTR